MEEKDSFFFPEEEEAEESSMNVEDFDTGNAEEILLEDAPETKRGFRELINWIVTLLVAFIIVFVVAILMGKSKDKPEELKETTQELEAPVVYEVAELPSDRTELPVLPVIGDTVYKDFLTYKKSVILENNAVYCIAFGKLENFGKVTKLFIDPSVYASMPETGRLEVQFKVAKLDGNTFLVSPKIVGEVLD